MISGDLDTIKKFALEDRDNLSSFLRICFCFDDVKAHLRNEFIRILKIFLLEKLEDSGWALKDRMSYKWDQYYPKLFIYKENFPLTYYHVAMEFQVKVAKRMAYGIRNGEDPVGSQPPNNDIWTILNDKVESGAIPNRWWSWSKYLDPPYYDWNNREALMQMFESIDLYNRLEKKGSMVEMIGDKLAGAGMVELIGNKLVGAALALDEWFKHRTD